MANNRLTYTVIFGLGVYAIYGIHGQSCSAPIPGVLDSRLSGRTYRVLQAATRLQCGKKCIASGSCQSGNFRKSDGNCQFISSANKASVIPAVGWEYIEKTDLVQKYGDPCEADPCPVLHTCVKLKSGDNICVITECGVPPTLPAADIKNHRTENPVGNNVIYVCQSGYQLSQGSAGQLMCLASGNFAQIDFSCEQIQCGSPPGLSYAMISYTSVLVPGSSVEYACVPGYRMGYNKTKATIVCMNDGTWPTITFACSPDNVYYSG